MLGKIKFSYLIIFSLVIFLIAISFASAAKYTIRLGYPVGGEVYTSENPCPVETWSGFLTTFKNYVEFDSNGEIEVQYFPNGQLGSAREVAESCNIGTLEMALCSEAILANFVPEVLCLGMPYLFSSEPVAWRVLDGPFGQDLKKQIEEKSNMKVISFAENGFRNFTNNVRPIKTPKDMKGMKIRVMESPMYMKVVEALGAKPTPMPVTTLYTALQQGVVDGEENPLPTIELIKFYEVQKYMTMDGHVYSLQIILMNKDFLYSLPKNLQEVILVSAERASTVSRGLCQYWNLFYIEKFEKEGMEIYFPSLEEKQMFKEASQKPVADYVRNEIGSEWVDKIINAAEEAEKDILMGKK
jgi:C4-dicarboxylate-binding protein DctP